MLEYDRIDLSEGTDVNKCEDTSGKILKILIIKDIYAMGVMICL